MRTPGQQYPGRTWLMGGRSDAIGILLRQARVRTVWGRGTRVPSGYQGNRSFLFGFLLLLAKEFQCSLGRKLEDNFIRV